jgi:hypothetical protein
MDRIPASFGTRCSAENHAAISKAYQRNQPHLAAIPEWRINSNEFHLETSSRRPEILSPMRPPTAAERNNDEPNSAVNHQSTHPPGRRRDSGNEQP